ncbi:MAG: T9SS type A sorting domain-containing protein [Vicingaceae bacterium]|nr:T9SS type A sorting domain-containing protein [Vicingaceae bacterium]
MKHFFYTFLLFPIAIGVFSSCLVAQTYHPFPDSSAVWRIEYCYLPTPISSPYCFRYSNFINGDTIINGNTYSKIYSSDVLASDTLNALFVGAVREDTNKRVYLFADSIALYNINNQNPSGLCNDDILNKEVLLYDFSVSVGDTVFYQYVDSSRIYITSIDSVLVQSQYLKRYNYYFISSGINCPSYKNGLFTGFYYIEKIGHHSGIFEPYLYYLNDDWNNLLCFEDTEIAYPDSLACYNAVGINDATIKENSVKIYPNPNNGIFNIESPSVTDEVLVTIYNTSGQQIESLSIKGKGSIDISKQSNGIYFVKAVKNSDITTLKLIKN